MGDCMKITSFQCYVSAVFPAEYYFQDAVEQKRSIEYYSKTLDEICDGSIYFYMGKNKITPSIVSIDGREKKYIIKKYELPKIAERYGLLSISCSIDFDNYRKEFLSDDKVADTLAYKFSLSEFCKRISDLIVVANIAKIGSIGICDSVVIHDNKRSLIKNLPDMDASLISSARYSAIKYGWPTISDVKIKDVWDWAFNNYAALEAFDGTPLGRALSAYSRIFEYSKLDALVQLVWAMVGIESLYGKESTGINEQLRAKTEVIFGKQQDFKKRISKMYKFRSKFIHGKLDFPCFNLLYDGDEPFEKFGDDLMDACDMAIALLSCTLQYIASHGWSGLSFEYVVGNNNAC